MSQNPPDRRRLPRADLAASAVVLAGNRYAGAFVVENLSASGALLVGDPEASLGQKVKVILSLLTRPPLSLVAVVGRQELRPSGERVFAVEFRNVSPAAQDRIQRAVLASLELRACHASLPAPAEASPGTSAAPSPGH